MKLFTKTVMDTSWEITNSHFSYVADMRNLSWTYLATVRKDKQEKNVQLQGKGFIKKIRGDIKVLEPKRVSFSDEFLDRFGKYINEALEEFVRYNCPKV